MKYYLTFLIGVLSLWLYYMISNDLFYLFEKNWIASLTMVFGSFIAGATSEGGGAIAFPVFTLVLDIPPAVARNFSFAIQSVGMTSASLLIIGMKIPIERKTILYSSIGGLIGLLVGTFFLVDKIPGKSLKLFFVSLWVGFGVALYIANRKRDRQVFTIIPEHKRAYSKLILFGFIGGIITSFFGNGIDIFTFCLLTLFYGICEKVATPTSVILMTINTILGFFLHLFIIKDFQQEAFNYWLCCIPIVIFFAPLGAYVINFLSRKVIAVILYTVIIVQYIGALFILKPSFLFVIVSLSVILLGCLCFLKLSKLNEEKSTIRG